MTWKDINSMCNQINEYKATTIGRDDIIATRNVINLVNHKVEIRVNRYVIL